MEPGGQERPIPQYAEIEGQSFLEEGKNFYDQPPFNVIVSRVSTQTGTDRLVLHSFLTSLG